MIRKVIRQAKGERGLGASGSQDTLRPYEPIISHYCHNASLEPRILMGVCVSPFQPMLDKPQQTLASGAPATHRPHPELVLQRAPVQPSSYV